MHSLDCFSFNRVPLLLKNFLRSKKIVIHDIPFEFYTEVSFCIKYLVFSFIEVFLYGTHNK